MGIRTELLKLETILEKTEPKGVHWFVDGTNGSDTYSGLDWDHAKQTIQAAITAASAHDTILVAPKTMGIGATDPVSYAETLIIAPAQTSLSIIGVSHGRTQGGLPQVKKGSGAVALLTIRASGCLIANMGFNGVDATGGGILFDDERPNGDWTKTAHGTTIFNCHFKNCVGSTANNAATGGAIMWSAAGGSWQVLIKQCRFYKNVGDIVLLGTGICVPQDVVIEDCVFSGPAANVDCNLYLAGGSGMNGVIIRNCSFGQQPAKGGTNDLYIVATGCVGMLDNCTFGCQVNTTGGTRMTFKVGGTAANIPVTMHVVKCYGQSITADESGLISIN